MDADTMRRIQNFGTQHPLWDEYQKEKRRMIRALGKAAWEKTQKRVNHAISRV